ncbi:MAG: alkene reductase [Burkholderiales bacterium]|nr:alkene reductase [Burkholderiales bacterium]
MEKLFQPAKLGSTQLSSRVVMAPLTRSRANHESDAPTEMNARYYAQRASAGLIISEASQISPQGKGYPWTPGIYSEEQVAGWKLVTDAIHEQGGKIFIQLWHVGRISHPSLQKGGILPVAPSALKPAGLAFTESGMVEFETPRALDTSEIPGIVEDYRKAAENAMRAGFDGVEIHGANGYLLDQFMRDGSNKRTDDYGGSIENRSRLLLEVVDAICAEIGADKVGVRLSPASSVNDMKDSDPMALFSHVIEALSKRRIAYLHMVEGVTRGPREVEGIDIEKLRSRFEGAYIANNCYDRDLAISAVESGRADFVAFGRPFISNPDLVERLKRNAALAVPDQSTFYGGGEAGYTDYPALED